MNRDEIIKLAFKAGMHVVDREDAYFLKRFAALVAEREREQCAEVCEAQAVGLGQTREAGIAGLCATAIRARGQA